jgi:uracil-DNA glycosylase family 4
MTPILQERRPQSRILDELDTEIRACTRCADNVARYPVNPPRRLERVVPRPVLSTPFTAAIMLIGQAPGLTEYDSGRPFQGPAGQDIRSFFAACGVRSDEFDRVVFQTSAVKCFPGRKLNGARWEDRQPDGKMLRTCSDFLLRQIDIVNPNILVSLGGIAANAIDNLRGRPRRKLGDVVGKVEEWGDRYIIFLAHTSGASRFLNKDENQDRQNQGKRLLTHAVGMLRDSEHLMRF